MISPQLSANRSTLILKVDDYIYNNSEKEIEDEIIKVNTWVEKIAKPFKCSRSKTIIITFNKSNKSIRAQEKRLSMFSITFHTIILLRINTTIIRSV